MTKLALGTVQFGLDYGINNFRGKVPKKEVFTILKYASQNGIDLLDTSYAYGESEIILGEYIRKNKTSFNIVTKLQLDKLKKPIEIFHTSLSRLNISTVYGYLIHHFDVFKKNPMIWEELRQIRTAGKAEKIGFSLYYPGDLEYLLEKEIDFDIIQIPYSIFDQRFSPWFSELKKRNIEIHTRSVFLQGLVFLQLDDLSAKFLKLKPKLEKLNELSLELDISISGICLNFAILNPLIDKVIVGIDNKENLKENLKNLKQIEKIKKIYNSIAELEENDENIILPLNWK